MLMCSVGGILKNYNVVIAFEDLFVLMFTIFNVSKHVLQALAVFHYSHCNSEMFLTYQQIRKDEGFFFFFFLSLSSLWLKKQLVFNSPLLVFRPELKMYKPEDQSVSFLMNAFANTSLSHVTFYHKMCMASQWRSQELFCSFECYNKHSVFLSTFLLTSLQHNYLAKMLFGVR